MASPRTHGKLFSERAAQRGAPLVAPDGGWGWVIVGAFALNHFFVVPVIQTFGMIYTDKFKELEISATDSTLILNVNSAFGFGFGLMNGPLLRRFTYRQVAICGALFLFSGCVFISMSNSFTGYLLSFSVVYALGFSLVAPAHSLALNTYFLHRRGRATSLAMTITGFGPVLVPLLTGWMVEELGPSGTSLILGALVLHALPAAALLQPVRWHMLLAPAPEGAPMDQAEEEHLPMPPVLRKRTITVSSLDLESHSVYGMDSPLPERSRRPGLARSVSQHTPECRARLMGWHAEENEKDEEEEEYSLEELSLNGNPTPTTLEEPPRRTPCTRLKQRLSTFARAVVRFFDLGLLCEPGHLTLSLCMAVAMFAEINFSLLLPFILREMHGFNVSQTARVMAVMAAADIVSRFAAPYISDAANHAKPKTMYLASLALLVVVRSLVVTFRPYQVMLVIGVGLGLAKGIRTVYMPLVLPSHVPLHKLPAASGLQMVMNGLFFLFLGPPLGVLRDYTGSYLAVVIAVNLLTMVTVVTWSYQAIHARFQSSSSAEKNEDQDL